MAITVQDSGTQTAVVSTEHTLETVTGLGVYQLFVDCSNLALGDTVVVRIYCKVLSGSSSAIMFEASYSHPQSYVVKASEPVTNPYELVFKLEQTGGSARDFEWSVVKIG